MKQATCLWAVHKCGCVSAAMWDHEGTTDEQRAAFYKKAIDRDCVVQTKSAAPQEWNCNVGGGRYCCDVTCNETRS